MSKRDTLILVAKALASAKMPPQVTEEARYQVARNAIRYMAKELYVKPFSRNFVDLMDAYEAYHAQREEVLK